MHDNLDLPDCVSLLLDEVCYLHDIESADILLLLQIVHVLLIEINFAFKLVKRVR